LEYASSSWSPHTKRNIDKIEGVQRLAARATLNDWSHPKSTDTDNVITSPSPTQYSKGSPSMLEFLGWKPLEEHRLHSKLSLLYKIEQGIVAIPATVYLQPVTGYTTHIGNLLYHSLESTHIATASFLLPLCCGTHYLLQW